MYISFSIHFMHIYSRNAVENVITNDSAFLGDVFEKQQVLVGITLFVTYGSVNGS